MTSKLRPPKVCPVCGEDVPRVALACPECGADHSSGWRENAEVYDALDLPDQDFNYEEFVKQEFGSSRRPAIKKVWSNVVKLFGQIHVELLSSAPFVQTVELHFPL